MAKKKKSHIDLEALQVDHHLNTEEVEIIEPKKVAETHKDESNPPQKEGKKLLTDQSIIDLEKKNKLLRIPVEYENTIYTIQKEAGAHKLSSSDYIITAIKEKLQRDGY